MSNSGRPTPDRSCQERAGTTQIVFPVAPRVRAHRSLVESHRDIQLAQPICEVHCAIVHCRFDRPAEGDLDRQRNPAVLHARVGRCESLPSTVWWSREIAESPRAGQSVPAHSAETLHTNSAARPRQAERPAHGSGRVHPNVERRWWLSRWARRTAPIHRTETWCRELCFSRRVANGSSVSSDCPTRHARPQGPCPREGEVLLRETARPGRGCRPWSMSATRSMQPWLASPAA